MVAVTRLVTGPGDISQPSSGAAPSGQPASLLMDVDVQFKKGVGIKAVGDKRFPLKPENLTSTGDGH